MKKIFVSALVALCGFTASYAQQASFLSNNHCLYRISQESQNQKCLLLPVQEDAEMANIKVIADNKQVKAFNVKLAKDHVDYFVPLYMHGACEVSCLHPLETLAHAACWQGGEHNHRP